MVAIELGKRSGERERDGEADFYGPARSMSLTLSPPAALLKNLPRFSGQLCSCSGFWVNEVNARQQLTETLVE